MEYTKFIKEAHEHKTGKVCTKCTKHKPFSEFYPTYTNPNRLRRECKSCTKEYKDNMCPFKKWFKNKQDHSKATGIEFTIEPEDITSVKIIETVTVDRRGRKYKTWKAIEYPKVCFKWGIELDWGMNGIKYNSPSLDRIDPTKGYISGNVRLVSNAYNMAKLNCPPGEWDVLEKQMARFILFGNR